MHCHLKKKKKEETGFKRMDKKELIQKPEKIEKYRPFAKAREGAPEVRVQELDRQSKVPSRGERGTEERI